MSKLKTNAAKIIATLGPQSGTPAQIRALAEAGARAFRINLAYDDAKGHTALVAAVRESETALGIPLALIADLSGPRLRIGNFADGSITLEVGQDFRLDQDEALGDQHRVTLDAAEAYGKVNVGDMLRLDDGRVVLRVQSVNAFALSCRVVAGTELSSRKIIALPGYAPRRDVLNPADKAQIEWAAEAGVDWIGVSWPGDAKVWADMTKAAGTMKVLAKVDSRRALEDYEAMIAAADGLVVARGDMGYDMPPEEIPGWQKRLVRAARRAGKPVVIAAQMLESMVESPAPTRAEASDVANAVKDGADALMLSAETAVGAYPAETVEMMASVIRTVELEQFDTAYASDLGGDVSSTIAKAAAQVADELSAPFIYTFTSTGSTALSVARMRPKTPVVCACDSAQTLRQMQLVWGLNCHSAPALEQWRDVVETAKSIAKAQGVGSGAPLVITAGMPFGTAGSTNILRVATAD